MKKRMFFTAVALAALFSANVAAAGTYTVRAGDCLSAISKDLPIKSWKELAKQNNLQPPYRIYPGQELSYEGAEGTKVSKITKTGVKKYVRKTASVEMRNGEHPVRHLGGNKFRGQGNLDLAWKQFSLTEQDTIEINQKMAARDCVIGHVKIGDKFDLGLEGKNVLQVRPVMAWTDHTENQLEAAYVYTLSSGKEIWILFKCDNPYLRIAKSKKEVVPGPVTPDVGITGDGKVQKFVSEGKGVEFFFIPPVEANLAIEHEPILGAWMWENKLAEGKGGYAEYMAFLRKESIYGYADGWSPGLGLYYMDSDGSSRVGTYSWDETAKGFQAGMKYTSPEFQWSTKFRLVWEEIDGRNEEGYSMHQEGVKPGVYTEYLDWTHLKDGWLWGASAEAWLPISEDITSSWADDVPADRSQVAVNLFIQKKLSEDWQARLAGGIFWQEWDDLIGLRAQAELRWKEIIMFGPWVSVFPFGISDAYVGISAWDLTTVGAFVRLEVAGILRIADRERRKSAIKEANRKWLDDLLTEHNL